MNNIQINLLIAWVWILLGFLSGMVLGLGFHREDWLGGYASFKRRLYRLGHISFFGLGAVNLMFYLTMQNLVENETRATLASWSFAIGAVAMPATCLIMAHFPRLQTLFALPVGSLLIGGVLTLLEIVKL